ncbi:hypothetical protein D3C72_2107070 [compost metagenome]
MFGDADEMGDAPHHICFYFADDPIRVNDFPHQGHEIDAGLIIEMTLQHGSKI